MKRVRSKCCSSYKAHSIGNSPNNEPLCRSLRCWLRTGPRRLQVDRRFDEDATVGEVRAFLTLHLIEKDIPIQNFSMSTNFPRRTYEDQDDRLSVKEAGLHPKVVLFVTDLDA